MYHISYALKSQCHAYHFDSNTAVIRHGRVGLSWREPRQSVQMITAYSSGPRGGGNLGHYRLGHLISVSVKDITDFCKSNILFPLVMSMYFEGKEIFVIKKYK